MKKKIENYEQAKEKALTLLEFRSHSEKELSDKLRINGADDEMIEEVLEFCRRYGFVNDGDYALRKARDLYNLKKYGKYRIEQELRAKGIDSEYIARALEELEMNPEDLKPLVEKKLNSNFDKKNIDKCIRYFLYRGYEFSHIKECIEEIKGEAYDL